MDRLVVVQITYGLPRAQATKAYLESHAVPVVLSYESAGPAIGVTFDGLGEVRVLVPRRLARRARRLLLFDRRPHGRGRTVKARASAPYHPTGRPGRATSRRPR